MPKLNGKQLAKLWGLDVKSALYSNWGNFYGLINETQFPAALIDKNGYITFSTYADLLQTPGIQIGKRINVHKLISTLPGYVRVFFEGEERITSEHQFKEGGVFRVPVNRYERDQRARAECIKHYGAKCCVCGIDFASEYGEDLKGFIHVHHKTPLSEIKESYQVDPIQDLIPLCPNCHAVVHKFDPPLSIEELKSRFIPS